MKKVVILGCENSHADDFLRIINENKEFSEIEVVGVYSKEEEGTTFTVRIPLKYIEE